MKTRIAELISQADGKKDVKLKFLNRVNEGKLTRERNPISHFCVYFTVYDPQLPMVFIGHHKKSGLWLYNGGHMEAGELPKDTVIREAKEEWGVTINADTIPNPQLITLTKIEHPERQICQWHYDFWHFLPMPQGSFHPLDASLRIEFYSYGWKTYDEAKRLLVSQPTREALHYLRNRK